MAYMFRALAGLEPASMPLGLVGQCGYYVHRFGVRRVLAGYRRHGRRVDIDGIVGEWYLSYRVFALGCGYVAVADGFQFVSACPHLVDECLLLHHYLLG